MNLSHREAETSDCLTRALDEIKSTDQIYLADLDKLLIYEPDNLITDAIDVIKHSHEILQDFSSTDALIKWPNALYSAYSQYIDAYHYDPSDTERYSYLKRRPFLRLSYLSKMLRKIEPLDGRAINCAALDSLASQARDKVQRQMDQVDTRHFAFNKVRSFDTFEHVSGSFDPSTIINRDLFEFQLLLPSNRWSARITTELLILSDNSVAVCSLEQPGRALMFPVFRRGELIIDQSTAPILNQDPSRKRMVKYGLVLSSGSKFIRLLGSEETKLKAWEQKLNKLLLKDSNPDFTRQLHPSDGLRISVTPSSSRTSLRSSLSSNSKLSQNQLQKRSSTDRRPRQFYSSEKSAKRLSKLSNSSSFKRLSLLLGDENFELMDQLKDVLGLEEIEPEPSRIPAPVVVIKGPSDEFAHSPFSPMTETEQELMRLEETEKMSGEVRALEDVQEEEEIEEEIAIQEQISVLEHEEAEIHEAKTIEPIQVIQQSQIKETNVHFDPIPDIVETLITPAQSPELKPISHQISAQNLRLKFNDKSNLYEYDTDGSVLDKLSSQPPTGPPEHLPLPLTPDTSAIEEMADKSKASDFSFLRASVDVESQPAEPVIESVSQHVSQPSSQFELSELARSLGMSQMPSINTLSSYQTCASEVPSFVTFKEEESQQDVSDNESLKTATMEESPKQESIKQVSPVNVSTEKNCDSIKSPSQEKIVNVQKPVQSSPAPQSFPEIPTFEVSSPKRKKSLVHLPWKSPKKASHEPKIDSPNKFMTRVKTNIRRALPLRRSKMSGEFSDLMDLAKPELPAAEEKGRFCAVSSDSMSSLDSQHSSEKSHKYSDSSASSAPSSVSSNQMTEIPDSADDASITLFRGASFVSRWSGQQWIALGNGQHVIHVSVSGSGGSIVASGLNKVHLVSKHEIRKSTAHDIQISKDQATTMYRFITPEAADRFYEAVKASRLDVKEQPLLYYRRQNGSSKASSVTSYESSFGSMSSPELTTKKRVSYSKRNNPKSDSVSNIATIMEEEEGEVSSFPSDTSMSSSSNSVEIRSVFRMPNNMRMRGLLTVTDVPAVPQLLLLNNLRCKFYGVDIHGKWTDGQFARLTVFSIANSSRKAVLIRPLDSSNPLFDETSLDASCFGRVGKVGISISLDDNPPKWMIQVKGMKQADHVYELFQSE